MHESGTFRYVEENLNYSKEAILKVFGKYFKTEGEAESCARNPQALADRVYGDIVMANDGQGICGEARFSCNARAKKLFSSLQRTWIYQRS